MFDLTMGTTAWAKVGRWWQKATVVKVPEMGQVVDGVRRTGDTIKCAIHSKNRKQSSAWIHADLIVYRDKTLNGADKPE